MGSMLDTKALSEYALSNMDSTHENVQNSLSLFQTFKRLHEKNPVLLNEILGMATAEKPMATRLGNFSYVLGLVTDKQALLITNLSEERSQIFLQPYLRNQIWTIGRDPNQASLAIHDRRLSRRHAAIRYIPGHGFLLADLRSTNGTYVNGARVRQSYLLQDGDLVRLGSLTFGFFTGAEFRRVGHPSPEVMQQLNEASKQIQRPIESPKVVRDESEQVTSENSPDSLGKTVHFSHQTDLTQKMD